jgi:hypothetical protein
MKKLMLDKVLSWASTIQTTFAASRISNGRQANRVLLALIVALHAVVMRMTVMERFVTS